MTDFDWQEMYTAIKQQQILQPQGNALERASISSGHGALLRAGSRRGQNDRVANLKRGSMRGIQSLFNAHGNPVGNDGRASPVPSFEVGMNVSSMRCLSCNFLKLIGGFL